MINYIEFTFAKTTSCQNVTGLRIYDSMPWFSPKLRAQVPQVINSLAQ